MNDDLRADAGIGFEQHRSCRCTVPNRGLALAPPARPISPPSAVTALLSAMFCGLNGATRTPRRCSTRHRPATSVLFPASEGVPESLGSHVKLSQLDAFLRAHPGIECVFDHHHFRYHVGGLPVKCKSQLF